MMPKKCALRARAAPVARMKMVFRMDREGTSAKARKHRLPRPAGFEIGNKFLSAAGLWREVTGHRGHHRWVLYALRVNEADYHPVLLRVTSSPMAH
jgi:hypothetical protein